MSVLDRLLPPGSPRGNSGAKRSSSANDGLVIELTTDAERSSLLSFIDDSDDDNAYKPPTFSPSPSESPDEFDDSDGYFSLLPDELCQQILVNLDVRSYLAMACTCTRMHNLCRDEKTFEPVASSCDSTRLAGLVHRPRTMVIQALKADKLQKLLDESVKVKKEARERMMWRGDIEAFLVYIFGISLVHELFAPIMLLLLSIMVPLKLDHAIDVTWGTAFFPLIIFTFFFLSRPLYMLYVWAFGAVDQDDLIEDDHWAGVAIGYFSRLTFVDEDEPRNIISYLAFAISGALASTLLMIQTGTQSMSWLTVMIVFAIWGLSALVMNFIFGEDSPTGGSDMNRFRIPAVLPLLSFVVGCLVIGCRICGYISEGTNWNTIFIPMYVALGLAVIMPLMMPCIHDDGIYGVFIAVVIGILVDIPLYVFLSLLASVLNGNSDLRFITLFIPIIVQFGVGFLVLLIVYFFSCISFSS